MVGTGIALLRLFWITSGGSSVVVSGVVSVVDRFPIRKLVSIPRERFQIGDWNPDQIAVALNGLDVIGCQPTQPSRRACFTICPLCSSLRLSRLTTSPGLTGYLYSSTGTPSSASLIYSFSSRRSQCRPKPSGLRYRQTSIRRRQERGICHHRMQNGNTFHAPSGRRRRRASYGGS